ncbi:sensor domain-containing diguanylate cyclase [Salisediminibacterium selenitireducens]|uniref:Diguanylate cyclase n=1 Tax=Bacillus selenitireducens (strain ATCC 700615 / DSM 15326 / MLS10) TaxID=439292 RepID=D6XXC4_BACIE|nr:diguanylate cyclase [Salisediminibacterium selenitireducens]ADH97981.1 diguanylate cyclase [[Bacillus] selenitireducens MLS10]
MRLLSKNKGLITVLAFVALTWAYANWFVSDNFQKERQRDVQAQMAIFQSELESITGTYQEFATYIYHSLINQPEILDIMREAENADDARLDRLRSDAYTLLLNPYLQIRQYNFRQLHLHLPDGSSFLRMHAPDEYGDPLYDVRETIAETHRTRNSVSGFEEGKIFNGYRYVFPLLADGELIGSGEVSLSLQAAIQILNDIYPTDNTLFILHHDVVDRNIFDDYRDNYVSSFISDDYYFDRDAILASPNRDRHDIYANYAVQHQIRTRAEDHLPNHAPFYFTIDVDGDDYLVQFVPITNFEETSVGYFITAMHDEGLQALTAQRNREFIYVNGFFGILTVFFTTLYYERRKIRHLAHTDQLTGQMNRNAFINHANRLIRLSVKNKTPLSVALLDIDHFKKINDTYGHKTGDQALQEIATSIREALDESDLFARWGGEEFVIMMPETREKEAEIRLDAIRATIAGKAFTQVGTITISIGITGARPDRDSLEQLIASADEALYEAKNKGRNRVVLYRSPRSNE